MAVGLFHWSWLKLVKEFNLILTIGTTIVVVCYNVIVVFKQGGAPKPSQTMNYFITRTLTFSFRYKPTLLFKLGGTLW